MIKKVKAINFKSFESIDVDLSNLNVVIGQNSSGKSNFVSIFQFIRDISTFGLTNAISLQGGLEYLLNFRNSKGSHLEIEIQLDNSQRIPVGGPNGTQFSDFSYKLIIYPFTRKKGMKKYVEEVLMKSYTIKNKNPLKSEIRVSSDNGVIHIDSENEELKNEFTTFFSPLHNAYKGEAGSLIGFFPLLYLFGFGVQNFIQVYDFDPKLSKRAIPISGKAELESDGSNTALVLKRVLSNKDEKKKFFYYLKTCLPFVKDVSFENQVDKSILFKMIENYNPNTDIPASIISDGTIEIISIIYALFYDMKQLIVIEEPERNIHPHLISNLMHLVKEAANFKQVIITTHSPELIKYLDLNQIYVIDRDRKGSSKVSRISDRSEIAVFLKEKIGVEDLFVDGILN